MYNSGFWNDWTSYEKFSGYVVEYGREGAEYELERFLLAMGLKGQQIQLLPLHLIEVFLLDMN